MAKGGHKNAVGAFVALAIVAAIVWAFWYARRGGSVGISTAGSAAKKGLATVNIAGIPFSLSTVYDSAGRAVDAAYVNDPLHDVPIDLTDYGPPTLRHWNG